MVTIMYIRNMNINIIVQQIEKNVVFDFCFSLLTSSQINLQFSYGFTSEMDVNEV